ncbi:arginase family protein [Ketobacter sp. MCCC 1A13808]|uniref:arginase family protein n=1 Tax=Ketobacter sp. MCCC 1A13808 TaxID=2602738 RepID=UPI0012EB9C46|nr:arginase family protein [Ketobacter sp. MCCC 1A13808]MVF14802.1 arginase family protein [Ketobacter sp. MCCC 1A13808]
MNFNLIYSQGRVGDKTEHTIRGAALTAQELEYMQGSKGVCVGKWHPPASDDWSTCLPQAQETLVSLKKAVSISIKSDRLTILASNTCSASLATLPVVVEQYPEVIILWFDAHGDFNTPETTTTGYLGGMVLAAACGLWDSGHGSGVRPEQVVLVGAHDIDPPERDLLHNAGVRVIPPKEVTPNSVLNAIGDAKVWIHIDWDVLEPGHIPADYEVAGGLVPKQIQAVLSSIPSDRILGIELAEFKAPLESKDIDSAINNIRLIVDPVIA